MAGTRQKVVDFVATQMKRRPDISMAELKELAEPRGLNVYPLILGLARKKLGIKSTKKKASKKKGSKKKAGKKRASVAMPASGGFGGTPGDLSGQLAGVLTHMQELEAEVQRLREILSQVSDLTASV